MVNINSKLIPDFDSIFPNEKMLSAEEYLAGINRTTLLKFNALLLALLKSEGQEQYFESVLFRWFSPQNIDFKNEIIERLKAIEANSKTGVSIINPLTSLQIIEHSLSTLEVKQEQSEKNTEINFFKAYCVINTWFNHIYKTAKDTTKNIEPHMHGPAIAFCTLYPTYDLTNYDEIEKIISQIYKAKQLLFFLSNNEKTKFLYQALLDKYESKDWRDYLRKYLPAALTFFQFQRRSHTTISIKKDKDYEANVAFFEKLVLQDYSKVEPDFSRLRAAPFFKTGEGEYLILFNLFALERIFKALYFELRFINDSLIEEERANKKNFRSFYTTHFSEAILFYNVLRETFASAKLQQYTGEELNGKIEGAPDYIAFDEKNIFLFECKDILINSEVKVSGNYEKYKEEFSKKLHAEGIRQLKATIKKILTGTINIDPSGPNKLATIYPILVLHEYQFNTFGLNYILNSWFIEEMKALEKEGLDISKVRNLVLVDIDTLIILRKSLAKDFTLWQAALDKYTFKPSIFPFQIALWNVVDRKEMHVDIRMQLESELYSILDKS